MGVRAEAEMVPARGGDGQMGEQGMECGWVEVRMDGGEEEGGVLAEMVREALVVDGGLKKRLRIGKGGKWGWRLVVDVCGFISSLVVAFFQTMICGL